MSQMIISFTQVKEVKPHPNADRLELIIVKGWQVVVKKDQFKAGDNVLYIPPDAILPKHMHEYLGITSYLAELPKGYGGIPETDRPEARRVRAARLRGQASYGTVITPVEATMIAGLDQTNNFAGWDLVTDIADALGITKWEPPVKAAGAGDTDSDLHNFYKYTSIEHWRNFPDIFLPAEKVVVTEKIHGTNCRLGYVNAPDENGEANFVYVAGSHNNRRKERNDKGQLSLYWEPFEWYPALKDMLTTIHKHYLHKYNYNSNVVVYGEIFGSSVQDMSYGMSNGKKDFRVFDISVNGDYLDYSVKKTYLSHFAIPMVPVLWSGPYDKDKIEELTDGKSTFDVRTGFTGKEGVVIVPQFERQDPAIGRVILKSVSVDYLARKGGTDGH